MTALLVARITVRNHEKMEAYSAAAGPTLGAHGGSFLGLGHFADALLGEADATSVAIVSFPSVAAARAWYTSPEYSALAGLRGEAADMALTLYEAA